MEHGIQISHLARNINLAEAMMAPFHVTLTDALRRCGTEAFSQLIEIIRRDHQFINLHCGTGIIATIKVMHAALSNSSCLPLILPLEPHANTNWTGKQYSEFFRETVILLFNIHPSLEICGITCAHLPALVAGLIPFLESRAEDTPRVMHIPCLNHLINLVFT